MKIVFICNEFPPLPHGGIGVFIKNLTKSLTANGFKCTVIGHYPITKFNFETIDSVEVIRLKEFRMKFLNKFFPIKLLENLLNKIRLNLFLLKYEKINKPDLIEGYEWNGPLLFKPRTKLVIRLHGSNTAHSEFENKPISNVLKFYESLNIKIGDVFVSVSKHMLEITEKSFGIIAKSKHVIYNSYNELLFRENDKIIRNKKKILFVGKFHERKGVFELFKILNELFKLDNTYIFHFVGPHFPENKLSLLALLDEDFHINVTFSTSFPQAQLPRVYNESVLMIIPSRAEAFGITVIEAMACGCVVAMSNLPVAKEIIDDNIDGLIIDSYNSKETAARIDLVLKNENLLKEMRDNARKKVANRFSDTNTLNQNIQFYKEIINDN